MGGVSGETTGRERIREGISRFLLVREQGGQAQWLCLGTRYKTHSCRAQKTPKEFLSSHSGSSPLLWDTQRVMALFFFFFFLRKKS